MNLNFLKDAWRMDGLTYAYSSRFPATPEFTQLEDCIENPPATENDDGYSYISLVTDSKLTPGITLSTCCSFDGTAAPLVVLAKELNEKDGVRRYSDYLEVVLYKGGVNVWKLWKQPDGTVTWHKLLGINMPMEEEKRHCLTVKIGKESFDITVDGMNWYLRCEDIYPEFHLGITGCEGKCRFYGLEITEAEKADG